MFIKNNSNKKKKKKTVWSDPKPTQWRLLLTLMMDFGLGLIS